MRMLNKNKQKLYYANYIEGGEVIYKLDSDGNKIVTYVDEEGNEYYEELGITKPHYTEPIMFKGNIAMSGGESEAVEFGLNLADYSAVLVLSKDSVKMDEKTVIWQESEPQTDIDGNASPNSADYLVVKVSPSLNVDKFVLRKVVK